MKWFEGDITEAITQSKHIKAVFVVFIHGSDNASKATLSAIDTPEVSSKLSSNNFVAIKLESGSPSYHQFVQIYQLVPVPSLFFIGESGVPLDVVPGEASSSTLLEHINKLQTANSPQQAETSTSVSSSGESKVESGACSTAESSPLPAVTPTISQEETVDQRIQRAEQARVAVAAKRQKEEQEREKQMEQTRRRHGQELAEAKRARDALEAQQVLEERRRERDQEREARERVLKQIAQDKQERSARQRAEPSAAAPVTPSVPSAPVPAASAARLQFRLPDGSSHTQVFTPDALLGDVRQYVRSTLRAANFSLSMAFPRTELATTDDSRTLQDLGLVPSAALLIIPISSTPSSLSPSGPGFMSFVWLVLSPFSFVWNFVSSYIWGGAAASSPPPQPGQGPAAAAAQARASQNADVRQRFRQEGNIHRLRGSRDSDDENNTYNGNSTQQM